LLEIHHIRRRISLGLVLVFCAALAVAFVHQATEIHGYCSEHGEVIHVDHDHEGHASHGRPSVHHEPEHSQGAHDCSFLLFLAQGQEVGPAAAGTAPDPARFDARHGRQEDAAAAISLLALSPKTSPPRG